jgi:hypothetical protein
MKKLLLLVSSLLSIASQAADPKPATPATSEVPKSIQVEVLDADGRRFVLVKVITSAEEFVAFEKDTQAITAERKQAELTKQLADIAITTPEKEARGKQLEAQLAKLTENNSKMAKTYNFDLTRQYIIVPTAVRVLTALSDEDYKKFSSAKDFKADSVVTLGENKKFQIRDSIKGPAEVETFKMQVGRVLETKRALQQLIDAQPRFTKDEDKKKIEEAIKNTQSEVNKSLEEFQKNRGFEMPNEFTIQTTEAKLYTLLTDEEKKSLDEKVQSKDSKSEATPEKK